MSTSGKLSLFRSTLEYDILLLLNGPPASGKSTVARLWVDQRRPLALNLDLDDLWLHLGRWQDDPTATGLAARELALAMCRVQLAAGRDVIVPQFLGRPEFIDQLAAVGGADFRHLVLLPPLAVIRQRFIGRRAHPVANRPSAMAAAADGLDDLYHRLVAFLRHRPEARVIELTGDEPLAAVFAQLQDISRNGPTESDRPG